MTPGARPHWERVREICLQALQLPVDERSRFLDAACAEDSALRAEVESLLDHEDPDFLKDPLVDLAEFGLDEALVDEQRRLGAYRLVRRVGRGGMGEVYLAVQEGDGFQRPVAVKFVQEGMATDAVLERFRLERSILAGLEHPNLARLIDGGATDDGLPYFVMEFVEGVTITEYCDEHRLDIPARLRLFVTVCEAVQHAHRSLVVHRDIKPSNILVTADGVPKLLDFGIGKVLDHRASAEQTSATGRVLTPEYAAPEQLTGGAVTTATDVHGLGMLLYELLAGHHPFAQGVDSELALQRALLETSPSPPSTVVASAGTPVREAVAHSRSTVPSRLRRALRGDLDNIVLVALRKEPERRYPSAEALKADIERHLAGLPVQARPDSIRYRASRFAARNPWGVAAAVLALVALGTAIVFPWQQNRRLSAERDKALAVQGFLLEAFGTTGSEGAVSAGELLGLHSQRVDSLYSEDPELRAEMLLVLSDALERVGEYSDAVDTAERALDLLREMHDGDHPEVARALNGFGWALHSQGRSDEAVAPLEEAVAMRRRLGKRFRSELSRSLNDLGVVRDELRDYEAAVALYREALEIRRGTLGDTDRATGVTASNLSVTLYRLGRYEEAQRESELALELMRASVGPNHQRTIIVQNNAAAMMIQAGDLEGAAAQYRDLLARQTRLQGEGHGITNTVRNGLAQTLFFLEEYEEAEVVSVETERHARDLGPAGIDHLRMSLYRRARIRVRTDRPSEAIPILNEAIDLAETARPDRTILAEMYEERRLARVALSDWSAAAEDQRRLIDLTADPPDSEAGVRHRLHLAELLARGGQEEAARRVLADASEVLVGLDVDESTLALRDRVQTLLGG